MPYSNKPAAGVRLVRGRLCELQSPCCASISSLPPRGNAPQLAHRPASPASSLLRFSMVRCVCDPLNWQIGGGLHTILPS